MRKSTAADAVLLLCCGILLVSVMLCARFLRGDFTSVTYSHTPVQSNVENFVVEKDGLFLLNINKVDADMLMMLDGIGEVMAGRIIDYREENGLFESVEELLNIKGIGEKTLEKMKPRIVCITEDEEKKSSLFGILEGLFE